MNFNEVLKNLRTEHHLTQVELANKLGLSFTTISMYERGQREPDFETLEAIADYFNVDMDYLLGKSPIPNKALYHTSSPEERELQEYLEELRTRPEMKMLFSLSKKATKEEVEQAVRIIEALRGDQSG